MRDSAVAQVTMVLPLDAPRFTHHIRVKIEWARWRRKELLLVEDDLDVRDTLQDLLESEGLDVIPAANGKQALDFLTLNDPPGADLVILDLMMPLVSGWEVLRGAHVDPDCSTFPSSSSPRFRWRGPSAPTSWCASRSRSRRWWRASATSCRRPPCIRSVGVRVSAGAPTAAAHVVSWPAAMDPERLRALLEAVRTERVSIPEALRELRELPFRDARVRARRHAPASAHGLPRGRARRRARRPSRSRPSWASSAKGGSTVLATRVSPEAAAIVAARLAGGALPAGAARAGASGRRPRPIAGAASSRWSARGPPTSRSPRRRR